MRLVLLAFGRVCLDVRIFETPDDDEDDDDVLAADSTVVALGFHTAIVEDAWPELD